MSRLRLDQLLVTRGLADSRAKAKAAIEAGGVTVHGEPAKGASQLLEPDAAVTYAPAHDYVGRGALKLAHALDLWPIAVAGRVVLDVGASTGGFSEVCLRRGAAWVYAVDVGRDQLRTTVAEDSRVVNLQGLDARHLDAEAIGRTPQLIVCDVSFIGLAKALPAALALAAADADLVTLVKPQFEMEHRGAVGRGGVVRNLEARTAALDRVRAWLTEVGWAVREVADSPITGSDGNREFLLWASRAA